MKRSAILAAAAFAVVACQDASAPNRALKIGSSNAALVTAAKPIPGSYIVVMKDAVANVDGEVDQIGQQYGASVSYRYKSALKGFAGRLSAAAVEALRKDPRIAYIEQDQTMSINTTTQLGATWGIDRIDQRTLPLSNTYVYDADGTGVTVYIIDTGINFTHSEYNGRAFTGIDEVTPGGTAADCNGHGSHVSGTVGGTIYGVAKKVKLVAVRVLDCSGSGSTSGVVAGIDWVTAQKNASPSVPSAANMSLGGGFSATLNQAVERSVAARVVYAIAAGNSNADACGFSPASAPNAITVGATDINDGFASFSNFGSCVDINAPGVNITSAWIGGNTATNTISGTSMATPHVAGTIALYLQVNPTATAGQVDAALKANASTTSVPSGTTNKFIYMGFISAGPPPPPPAAPTLVSPADAATGVTVPAALSWNASSGASSYTVQVSTSSAFTTLAYSASGITGTSTNATGLAASTVYYWRVNATNAGGTSAFSAIRSFTTASAPPPPPPPPAPVLSSPANAATGVAVPATLSWAASSGATSYNVQVSTSSTFTTLFLDRPGVTTTSTSVSGLAASTVYYWRVSATNAGGTSAYSAARSFTTAAAACTNGNCQN